MHAHLASVAGVLAAKADGGDVDVASIIGYIVVGAIVGVLARFLVPGADPIGILSTIVLGIVGALIGGWLAGTVFSETEGVDWIASVLVAIGLVLLVRALMGSRSDSARH